MQVPQGCGKTVLEIAKACEGKNLAQVEAAGIDHPLDLVFVHISNGKVEELLGKLQDMPDLSFTLL
ncbi:MAG: TIGR00341 family protein, partial [Phormidesmis sp. CAN_BIN44]|nr:TIGR00341 family protein [Phormidesmis sp. CAN_BIN44]